MKRESIEKCRENMSSKTSVHLPGKSKIIHKHKARNFEDTQVTNKILKHNHIDSTGTIF